MNKNKQLISVLEDMLNAAKNKNVSEVRALSKKYDSLCYKIYGLDYDKHPSDMDLCKQSSFFAVTGITHSVMDYSKSINEAENQLRDIKKKYNF